MIGKLLGRLLGSGSGSQKTKVAATEQYNGFELRAAPIKDANGWRVAGSIAKTVDGVEKTHDFVRADTYPSHDDAVAVSLRKGRLLVDERGDDMFG